MFQRRLIAHRSWLRRISVNLNQKLQVNGFSPNNGYTHTYPNALHSTRQIYEAVMPS